MRLGTLAMHAGYLSASEIEHIRIMIKEVNNTQLNAEEILSDNPYYFDKETGKLCKC